MKLKDMNLASIRKFIGYVGQEPALFNMSIRENLTLARKDATEEEIKEALTKTNAWSFIERLENGLDTYVGSGGCQLSGGQKQRIAIARAILLNPPILLLDESTSALDRKNEREIQATLDQFAQGRTTITIAHRLTTIMNSDIIFCIKDGVVAEKGSHKELMTIEDGAYHNLVKYQYSEVEDKENSGFEDIEDDQIDASPIKNDTDLIMVENPIEAKKSVKDKKDEIKK